jgi:hypothetical protein
LRGESFNGTRMNADLQDSKKYSDFSEKFLALRSLRPLRETIVFISAFICENLRPNLE